MAGTGALPPSCGARRRAIGEDTEGVHRTRSPLNKWLLISVLVACVVLLTPEVYVALLRQQPQQSAACVDSDGKLDAIHGIVANATHHAQAEVQPIEYLNTTPEMVVPPQGRSHGGLCSPLSPGADAAGGGVAARGCRAHPSA
jgi:hypothetical protein